MLLHTVITSKVKPLASRFYCIQNFSLSYLFSVNCAVIKTYVLNQKPFTTRVFFYMAHFMAGLEGFLLYNSLNFTYPSLGLSSMSLLFRLFAMRVLVSMHLSSLFIFF